MTEDVVEATQDKVAVAPKAVGRGLTLKVSEKGGLSVYGLGRFPVTLYKEQWLKLLEVAEDIRAFVRDNDAALKSKGPAAGRE